MARQHGYIAMIPVFIPVDAKSLKNQIAAGTALHEAAQTRDLGTITSLPGIRLHIAKDRAGVEKDIIARWTSVEVEGAPASDDESVLPDIDPDPETTAGSEDDPSAKQDEVTTTGRKRRAA